MRVFPNRGRSTGLLTVLLLAASWPALAMPETAMRPLPRISRHYHPNAALPSGYHVANARATGVAVPRIQYEGVRGFATEILERCPPKGYYYVFMGHSPGRLASFFEALSPDLGQTFPASGLGDSDKTAHVDTHYAEYQRHFEALLPQDVLHGNRKLLLVDYTSGTSPNNLRHGLLRYLKEIGSSVQVETASFKEGKTKTDHQLSRGDISATHEYPAYDSDEISQYGYSTHSIGTARLESLVKDTSKWPRRVAAYKEWMAQDLELDQFLATHLADLVAAPAPQ